MNLETFVLPHIPPSLSGVADRVAVVGLLGKSSMGGAPLGDKGAPLSSSLYGSQFPKTPDEHCRITGYYDPNRKTVMLQLTGPLDAALLKSWLEKYHHDRNKQENTGDKKEKQNQQNDSDLKEGDEQKNDEKEQKDMTSVVEQNETEQQQQQNSTDFLTVHAEMKAEFARALVFLFQVCHVLVVHIPGTCFDLSYVGLFTAVDNARQRFLSATSACLRDIGVTSRWYQAGRLCSPRVLFLFDKSPKRLRGTGGSAEAIKTLEHALEDQIYRVLRKARVVTNRSADSLFSIPKNDEFVHVQTGEDGSGEDRLGRAVRDLVHSCQKFNGSSSAQKDDNPFGNFGRNPYINGGSPPTKQSPFGAMGACSAESDGSFSSLLQQHIDTALGPGFEDNVGKYAASTPTHFEVPKLKTWCNAVQRLYVLYYGDDVPKSPLDETDETISTKNSETTCAQDLTDTLREALNIDVRFSEARCAKVWPVAKALYLEGLPSHYGTGEHNGRLAAALASLAGHARGPRSANYRARLVQFATNHWRDGRELCEAPSLTGRPCVRPKLYHKDGAVATSCVHSSGVTTLGACDCGRTVGRRDDPYDARTANHQHYVTLGRDCACAISGGALQRMAFPVFQPSTDDFRAAQLFPKPASIVSGANNASATTTTNAVKHSRHHHGNNHSNNHSNGNNHQQHQPNATTGSVVLMTSQSQDGAGGDGVGGGNINDDDVVNDDGDDNDDVDEGVEDDDDVDGASKSSTEGYKDDGEEDVKKIVIQVSENDVEQNKDKGLVRQPSTTEYLPGMLHTRSPAGLLPQFPSWSLVCLGPSSLYSHNLGLSESQHPGFIAGANFLLPWDVMVRLEHSQPWPAMVERSRTRKSHKNYGHSGREPASGANKANEFVVKIFVGVEYECPRGHRFMMSRPDKILRANTGLVKDSGNRVASSDMPLFFECPCRNSKPQLAQLMRVHVVSPKAPVHVTLDPKVQPGGGGGGTNNNPIFITGFPAPIKLTQSSYWVLRLPYVYVGDRTEVFRVNPGEGTISGFQYGRLLQGMYGISEMERE